MMSSKGSYFKKYTDKNPDAIVNKRPPVRVSDEVRKGFEEGRVILIDKQLHWTSFDVVKKIRNAIHIKKVGHAGTLDPLASGLLIICTGKFTKKINEFMRLEKEYTGSFTLGAVTPTYDLESDPEQQKDISGISEKMIIDATQHFLGDILQKPPVYSAIKKAGTPLYALARRGEDIDLEPRPIHVSAFKITAVHFPVIEFLVTCSTGTYIRSLAHDFGQLLGCGAYLSALRRTKIGEYSVVDALPLDDFLDSIDDAARQNG